MVEKQTQELKFGEWEAFTVIYQSYGKNSGKGSASMSHNSEKYFTYPNGKGKFDYSGIKINYKGKWITMKKYIKMNKEIDNVI